MGKRDRGREIEGQRDRLRRRHTEGESAIYIERQRDTE